MGSNREQNPSHDLPPPLFWLIGVPEVRLVEAPPGRVPIHASDENPGQKLYPVECCRGRTTQQVVTVLSSDFSSPHPSVLPGQIYLLKTTFFFFLFFGAEEGESGGGAAETNPRFHGWWHLITASSVVFLPAVSGLSGLNVPWKNTIHQISKSTFGLQADLEEKPTAEHWHYTQRLMFVSHPIRSLVHVRDTQIYTDTHTLHPFPLG